MKTAWVNIHTYWKGGQSIAICALVTLFELDLVTGFYRCSGYRQWSHGGTSSISYVSEDDVVKIL